MKKFLILIFLSFSLACTAPKEADLILTNASIVSVIDNSIIPDQLIAISENRILAVDDAKNLSNYSSKRIIDLDGKYVMPGLWDNHAHFRGGKELVDANKNLLPLFLSFGVTAVRDAGGDITPSIREWNALTKKGELSGPTIFTPGPKLDGDRPAWEGSLPVTNSTDVNKTLDSLESINADFVKMYDGNLTKEAFYQIIEEAEKRGLKTTGHMPLSADLMKAVELGLDGTEHLYYVLKLGAPNIDELENQYNGYSITTPLMENYDEATARSNFKKIAEYEFYVTPTLHIGKTLAELLVTDHSEDTLLNYISPKIQETYNRRFNSAKRGGEAYTEIRGFWVESFKKLILPLHESGVLILAGSDSGPSNSFTYPGESIHRELELLVDAGLSPAEALSTSFINGPMFFGLEGEYGSIEYGKIADMLILNNNPIDDITHTTNQYGVIKNGQWYSKSRLNQLMQSIKN